MFARCHRFQRASGIQTSHVSTNCIADASLPCLLHSIALLSCMCTFLQNSSQQLQHLLRHVADSHRRRVTAALLVGYTMKPSRERNLASRGLLPLTAPHGVCFVPVDFGRPLEQQGPFDVMLHKVKPNSKPCLNLFVTIIPLSMCPCHCRESRKVFGDSQCHRPACSACCHDMHACNPICCCAQHPDSVVLDMSTT